MEAKLIYYRLIPDVIAFRVYLREGSANPYQVITTRPNPRKNARSRFITTHSHPDNNPCPRLSRQLQHLAHEHQKAILDRLIAC